MNDSCESINKAFIFSLFLFHSLTSHTLYHAPFGISMRNLFFSSSFSSLCRCTVPNHMFAFLSYYFLSHAACSQYAASGEKKAHDSSGIIFHIPIKRTLAPLKSIQLSFRICRCSTKDSICSVCVRIEKVKIIISSRRSSSNTLKETSFILLLWNKVVIETNTHSVL